MSSPVWRTLRILKAGATRRGATNISTLRRRRPTGSVLRPGLMRRAGATRLTVSTAGTPTGRRSGPTRTSIRAGRRDGVSPRCTTDRIARRVRAGCWASVGARGPRNRQLGLLTGFLLTGAESLAQLAIAPEHVPKPQRSLGCRRVRLAYFDSHGGILSLFRRRPLRRTRGPSDSWYQSTPPGAGRRAGWCRGVVYYRQAFVRYLLQAQRRASQSLRSVSSLSLSFVAM